MYCIDCVVTHARLIQLRGAAQACGADAPVAVRVKITLYAVENAPHELELFLLSLLVHSFLSLPTLSLSFYSGLLSLSAASLSAALILSASLPGLLPQPPHRLSSKSQLSSVSASVAD